MKVAIFISGQPRLVDLSIINHLKSQDIDYDIFIHYWIPKTTSDDEYSINTSTQIRENNLMYQNNVLDILKESYNPIKIVGEVQREFEPLKLSISKDFRDVDNLGSYEKCDSPVNPKVPQSCAYSCQKAFNLCENPNEYDWLMKIRFDTFGPLFSPPFSRPTTIDARSVELRNECLKFATQANVKIDFTKCSYDSVNFLNITEANKPWSAPSDRGEPMSEIWITSNNKCSSIFNYYDDLVDCGSHPANESIIYRFCMKHNLNMHSLGAALGYNRNYNFPEFIFN